MNEKELLDLILKTVKEQNLSAAEIGNGTNISTFTVSRILKGETKKPNRSTLIEILKYLEKNLTGVNLPISGEAREPQSPYWKADDVADYIIENTDELLKNKKFANWYNNIILTTENKVLRELNKK